MVCVVDVKSRLREEGIDQILRTLRRFPRFFPEHRGKRLIGVLAVVDVSPEVEQRVLREGLVLARIRDDVFELRLPAGYEPRSFPNPPGPGPPEPCQGSARCRPRRASPDSPDYGAFDGTGE